MIRQILKQLKEFKQKYGKYPSYINITKYNIKD